jgi:hypothetical protein
MLVIGAASVTVALAAIPDTKGVIHGCYRRSDGRLRVIDTARSQKCLSGERALNWNKAGPPAPLSPSVKSLTASVVVSDVPTSSTITWTQPAGTVASNVYYRLRVTTPSGACDAEPEAGSVVGNYSLNVDTGHVGGFNQTFLPGTTLVPKLGSDFAGAGALFPGTYVFKTEVTNPNLVAACFGTVFKTQVFVETVLGG